MKKKTVHKSKKKEEYQRFMTNEEFMEDRINTYGKEHKIPKGNTCDYCYYHDAQYELCDLFLQPAPFYSKKLKECIEFIKDKK